MPMEVLVTGGAGFIGCNFVRHTAENTDWKITVLDNLTYAGKLPNLDGVLEKIKFVKGNICNKKLVGELVKEADLIVNFAAETHVDRSIKDSSNFVKTNVVGVYTILEACRQYDKRMLQISTDEVYGSIVEGSFTEESKLDPRNPYSATKACGDLLAISYNNTYGLRLAVTRTCNNFGYYQNKEKFIPTVILNAIRERPVPVYGEGKNIRDWIFVIDNCKALETVINKGSFSGNTYNISAYTEKTNIEVAKMILSLIGKPHSLIKFVQDRPGHDFRYSIKADKIADLGWKPTYSFEEGLKETINWYKKIQ